MRYYLILIPPTLISLWTIFQVLSGALTRPRYVHKFFLIVNHSALFKDLISENFERSRLQDSFSTKKESLSTIIPKKENSTAWKSAVQTVVNCSKDGKNLVGELRIDQSIVKRMEDLEKLFSVQYGGWVNNGGEWKPENCRAKKVAIILPYRNRYEQLKIFLRHLHPILKRQLLDYRIFIIEQNGTTIFNRAILFNIGFMEAQKFNNYQCFIFHDVDLLPEDDRNMYNCVTSPRHMCPAVDKFFYKLPYHDIFGGVEAIWKQHFEKVNGFSNKYWGWGGEDDDLYHRCTAKGLKLTRPSMKIGRYKMLKKYHYVDSRKNQGRTRQLLNNAVSRMKYDGLNTLKYNLLQTESLPLYTHIRVAVNHKEV
ncbi:beta-1,4-galactosyltransferase 1-like [Dendronephthya gigantea]|uniref:beta-1,4-galactosyltransferase 1-like n=1 Tax=Dendronephthya gigantea TaxID=151771 RepID=UPI0010693540|nr:beta-1,4-galactosyltransferase 1-like [Dendronephthya gigantea]